MSAVRYAELQCTTHFSFLRGASSCEDLFAKAAQLGLTRSWALELAPAGITVNLVAPGWIPTERHVSATPADLAAYTAGVPMKRMGTPEDVAKLVAFLAGPHASFITGQKFAVNGANTLA